MSWERIADVNLNRMSESLKFLEDIARFTLRHRTLVSDIRTIRRNFLDVTKKLSVPSLVKYRESRTDIGRSNRFDVGARSSVQAAILANCARAQQAARILEEVSKSADEQVSPPMKRIRFRLYDLEKAFIAHLQRTFDPRLYVILDERYASRYRIEYIIPLLARSGATMIQLRAQAMPDRTLVRTGVRIRRALVNPAVKFIINNRLDIALACGADGVHLGQRDISVVKARQIVGEHAILGVSVHTVQQARRAQRQGADYLGVGAVFATKTKTDARVRSLSVLKAICAATHVPVIGIGGINDKNYRTILKAGAAGISVCSFVFEGNVRKNVRSLTQKRG